MPEDTEMSQTVDPSTTDNTNQGPSGDGTNADNSSAATNTNISQPPQQQQSAQQSLASVPYLTLNENLYGKLETPKLTSNIDPEQEHKLMYTWCISEMSAIDKPQYGTKAHYATDNIHKIGKPISTIQDFWRFYNYLPQPSDLFEGKRLMSTRDGQGVSSLMIFRLGIQPEWEDPLNSNGGEFQFKLTRRNFPKQSQFQIADECWNNLMLGMVGGCIEPASMITGLRLLDRMSAGKNPLIRVEVWFTDAKNLSDEDKGMLEREFGGDYHKLVKFLLENIEKCMQTRLNGEIDANQRFWDEVTPSMHNATSKK